MDERLLEPLKYYEQQGAREHEENVTAYFEELVKRSQVNVEENRDTVKKYNAEKASAAKVRESISRRKVLRGFLIFGIIVAIGLGIFGGWRCTKETWQGIAFILGAILLLVGGILFLVKKVNPSIRSANEKLEEHERKAASFLSEAERQMQPLNALFDNVDTLRLIKKTLPDFEFDDHFTVANQSFFQTRHDFVDLSDEQTSTVDTLSGRFVGNPFFYSDTFHHQMGLHTYHGSLFISWTETQTDSEGRTRTYTRTQTLYASLTKPKPEYYYRKRLFYGCQAAPDLSFSRKPQHSERLSEEALDKKVEKKAKKIKKKAEKATKKGKAFQEMNNEEFDVLFGALDRDHEVQFRLMYTPLAQSSTVDLLTSTVGYGDDFSFHKSRRLNVITSEHAQGWSMNTSPDNYYSHDVDAARKNFVGFNTNYFKSLFFDFAPLFSIPSYLEEPCDSLEALKGGESNYTKYEHEAVANAIGAQAFAHENTATKVILKTSFAGKNGDSDRVDVTAYSYAAIERLDFVPVRGGDGDWHNVPVPWVEYVPVHNVKQILVSSAPNSTLERREAGILKDGQTVFLHGLKGKLL